MNTNKRRSKIKNISAFIRVHLWLIFLSLFLIACSEIENPKPAPFYAETAPPPKKEFRWSNGKMPKSFDPAQAAAPPETDIVRAVFEGLTDSDPKTLEPIPAIALDWKSSDDFKTWTFNLRKDARWSNGERVTAKDFVRSWKRLADLGDKVSHRELLQNIVGLKTAETKNNAPNETDDTEIFLKPAENQNGNLLDYQIKSPIKTRPTAALPPNKSPLLEVKPTPELKAKNEKPAEPKFGVEAVDDFTLKVSLVNPDKNFPALVAHPIFRPIYGDEKLFETDKLNADIVTNGAFRVFSVGQDGITLDRAENYWNEKSVELDRVRFVPTENAEKALEAYRAGEVDAVTNAAFEPLALKLLTPFEDFQRTTHSAINLYEFNQKQKPFDERRVREALAIAIDRERLTNDEMEGASKPALSFLPFETDDEQELTQDLQKAKNLLAESGFPNGENFPTIKLLINRNNVQQRIARSVAKMWKQNLNIETEIVVKDSSEIADAWASGEFSMIRRGIVLPTSDETANMLTIFPSSIEPDGATAANISRINTEPAQKAENPDSSSPVLSGENPKSEIKVETTTAGNSMTVKTKDDEAILTEEQAISQLPAIPLYFPTSFSLVKPYIENFDINFLDAPSLKAVRINNNWQPKKAKGES